MSVVQLIPYQNERSKFLKAQILPLEAIQPCLDANCLVQGWFGAGGLSILYGPSNSGKTFVAVDLAMHVANGATWRGCKSKRGVVIYVAAEGGGRIRNRVSAMRQARFSLTAQAEFHLLPTHLDLHGNGDAMSLCEALPAKNAALIVVDTLARSMGSGDENSDRDVAQFIANLDAIRVRSGAHVMVIHHSGKNADSGARGSSALKAAVDTQIAITAGQITCSKQRDMEIPPPLFFSLESVELGEDRDGDPVTSAIVIAADAPAKTAKPLAGRDKVAAQALSEALRLHGRLRKGENFPNDRRSVEMAEWRERCRENGLTNPDASTDAQRKAFTRAKERLLDRDFVRVCRDCVWNASDDD